MPCLLEVRSFPHAAVTVERVALCLRHAVFLYWSQFRVMIPRCHVEIRLRASSGLEGESSFVKQTKMLELLKA